MQHSFRAIRHLQAERLGITPYTQLILVLEYRQELRSHMAVWSRDHRGWWYAIVRCKYEIVEIAEKVQPFVKEIKVNRRRRTGHG